MVSNASDLSKSILVLSWSHHSCHSIACFKSILVVYSRQVPAATKRRVTLFPTHNIILASHCANLPILQPSSPATPKSAGESISIPVVPLCIPAPEVFPPTFHLPLPQAHRPSPKSLQPCCLSQHLPPSTQTTPQARTCALSCSNSRPKSQHSPLHTFFSRVPWMSMASGGTPCISIGKQHGIAWIEHFIHFYILPSSMA